MVKNDAESVKKFEEDLQKLREEAVSLLHYLGQEVTP